MTATPEDIRTWLRAGLIDEATADRILAFEAKRSSERQATQDRPGIAEILVYLAAAITGAGFTVLVATNWQHLSTPVRVSMPALAAAALLAAGYRLALTKSNALVRGASLLWLVAGALTCTTAAIAANEAGWSENDTSLAAGVTAAIAAVSLWWPMRMHPQIAGMGGAALLLSLAISSRAADDWVIAVLGMLLAMIGLVVMIAVETGNLTPRASARLLAGAGLGFGAFFAGLPPSPPVAELLSIAVVGVLVAAGVRYQSLIYIAFGVLTAFAGLLKLILRHVEDPTLAALALIAIGLLLLAAILVLGRSKPWTRWQVQSS
jgi:uncharacterized membrane protein